MRFTRAAIYDINDECIVDGPKEFVTIETLAEAIRQYDVVFFKGGIVEVAFVRKFVNDTIRLIDLELLGCPNYNALIDNPEFLEAVQMEGSNLEACEEHQGVYQARHCATSEVATFGNWILLNPCDKADLDVIR